MAGLAVNELTTYRWSFEEDVAGYKAAGFEAIGVWRQKLADFGERRGIELIREAGLHVSSVLWAGGFTGSDGHSYQESIDDALDAIRLTAALDADCLVIYSGGRNGHTERCSPAPCETCCRRPKPIACRWPWSQCTPAAPAIGRS